MVGTSKRALFVVDDRPESGRGHVVRCGALADELRSRGWRADFMSRGGSAYADVLIVDYPSWGGIAGQETKTVYVVDTPGRYECDLLVAGGAGLTFGDFTGQRHHGITLFGPKYALLRPEFRVAKWGGSGDDGASCGVVDLRMLSGLPASRMAGYMASADVVVSYAGMRALEAACVGAPMVLVARNDGERLNAEALWQHGAAAVAEDKEDVALLAGNLLRSPVWLRSMSENARALVDGLGCKRVADAIEALF